MARVELNIVALGDFSSVNSQIKALQVQVASLNKNLAGVGLSNTLAKDLSAAQAAFKATMLSTGQFTVQTVKMASETEKFGTALTSGKLKLSQYFDIITGKSGQAAASMKALAAEQVKLQSSLVMADPAKRGILSVYTPTQINAVTSATKLATMQQNLYNLAVTGSSKALITWGKNTQWAGRQLTVGLSMPMIMFGAVAVKSFKDTNIELTRLQRLYGVGLTAPSDKQIAAISTQVMDLGKKIAVTMGIAQKETAATAADFAAIGRTGNDLITSTEQAMRLSKLGSIDSKQAFTGIMTLQNTFKVGSSDLAEAVNFMTAIQKQTALNLTDITDAFPRIGPIVKQLGGSYKDTAVMMLAMKEAGVPAAQAANALKSAMASMISPTTAAKDMFAKFNINLAAIATDTKGNPVKMVQALQKSLEGIEPLARAQLIEKLFGKFQFARVTALLDNLGRAGSQTQLGFKIAQASASDLAKLIDQEMRIATESTTAKWARAIEGFKATIYPVGQKFMEMGTIVLNIANKIAKAFSHLPGPVKSVLGIFAGLSLFAGPIIMLTGLLANFAGYILKGVVNVKALAKGGLTFKELLTPEIIASQNAAELFSSEIAKDVEAVDLLNQAVKQLTVTLEGMAGAMSATAGAEIAAASAAATAKAASYTGGIYHVMGKQDYGAFGYKGKTDYAIAKPTTGFYAYRSESLNQAMANEGVAAEKLIAAMTEFTGETQVASKMFHTSVTDYINKIVTMTDEAGQAVITQEQADKILSEINIELKANLEAMQKEGQLITDINMPLAQIADKVMMQNAAISANPAEFQRMWTGYNTATSKITDPNRPSGGGRSIPITSGIYGTGKESVVLAGGQLEGGRMSMFYHTKNEEFLKFRQQTIDAFRKTAQEAGIVFDETLIAQIDKALIPLAEEAAKAGQIMGTAQVTAMQERINSMFPAMIASEANMITAQSSQFAIAGTANGNAYVNNFKARLVGLKGGFGAAGMGISMAAMMGGMALSGKGGAAGEVGSVLSTVGTVTMLASFSKVLSRMLPEVAIAVGIITIASKALSKISKDVKDGLTAEAQAFKASGEVAQFFGQSVKDASTPLWNIKKAAVDTGEKLAGFNLDMKKFTDTVNSLPKDNPTSLFLEKLKNEMDPEKIKKMATEFVNTQVAINNLDPKKANELLQLVLGYSGHAGLSTQGFNLPVDQATAFKRAFDSVKLSMADLNQMAPNFYNKASLWATHFLGFGMNFEKEAEKAKTLFDAIGNTTDFTTLQSALDGIGKSVYNNSKGVLVFKNYLTSVGSIDMAKAVGELGKLGYNLKDTLIVAEAAKFGLIDLKDVANAPSGGDYYSRQAKTNWLNDLRAKLKETLSITNQLESQINGNNNSNLNNPTTFTGTLAEKELKKKLEAKIKIENSVLKTLKDQLSVEQKRTQEMQRQFDYQNNMQDLSNKSKEAMISGNYLEAAGLGQQRQFLTMQFNQGTVQNKLQGQIDVIQARTDVFSEALADLNDAIANGIKTINKTILQRYNLPVLNSKNTKVDSGGLAINVTVNSPSADHSAIANAARDKVLQALKTNNEKSNRTNHVILEGQHFRSMG